MLGCFNLLQAEEGTITDVEICLSNFMTLKMHREEGGEEQSLRSLEAACGLGRCLGLAEEGSLLLSARKLRDCLFEEEIRNSVIEARRRRGGDKEELKRIVEVVEEEVLRMGEFDWGENFADEKIVQLLDSSSSGGLKVDKVETRKSLRYALRKFFVLEEFVCGICVDERRKDWRGMFGLQFEHENRENHNRKYEVGAIGNFAGLNIFTVDYITSGPKENASKCEHPEINFLAIHNELLLGFSESSGSMPSTTICTVKIPLRHVVKSFVQDCTMTCQFRLCLCPTKKLHQSAYFRGKIAELESMTIGEGGGTQNFVMRLKFESVEHAVVVREDCERKRKKLRSLVIRSLENIQ